MKFTEDYPAEVDSLESPSLMATAEREVVSSRLSLGGEGEIVFHSDGGPSIFGNTSLIEDALLRESISRQLGS